MRVLFLSNFYPPASRGGYEQWCQEVAEGLLDRGHHVALLTSRDDPSVRFEKEEAWIHRDLHLEMEFASLRNSVRFFINRSLRERQNLTRLEQLVGIFQPEVILVWGMWNLSTSLPAKAEELVPGRVVYYMGDYWPTLPSQWWNYWQERPRNRITAAPKLLLRPIANRLLSNEQWPVLGLDNVIFPTAFLRDQFAHRGIRPRQSRIISGAVDTSRFLETSNRSVGKSDDVFTLLYLGRLTEDKGVHSAVEALSHLVNQQRFEHMRLIVVGDGEPEYKEYLHQLARDRGIAEMVEFRGVLPKEDIPNLYTQADVLVFTSIWPEPFGRVIVEAMASGVAVVGSATGGAAEIMADNVNALVFSPGDAAALASQVARLVTDPLLRLRLVERGRQTAVEKYDIRRMTSEIEVYLRETSNALSARPTEWKRSDPATR